MKVNDEADSVQATKDDPRKTKFGNFMRHTNIDELPQFWNVFTGTMSIVGPSAAHAQAYGSLLSAYFQIYGAPFRETGDHWLGSGDRLSWGNARTVADGGKGEKGPLVYRELVIPPGLEDYLADGLERDLGKERRSLLKGRDALL
jgi:hypothetical protein